MTLRPFLRSDQNHRCDLFCKVTQTFSSDRYTLWGVCSIFDKNSHTHLTDAFQENRDSFPDLGELASGRASLLDQSASTLECYDRTGLMVVYDTLTEFKEDLFKVLNCFGYWKDDYDDRPDRSISPEEEPFYGAKSPPGCGYDEPSSENVPFYIGGSRNDPPGAAVHTLNVFIRSKKGGEEDVELEPQFQQFCSDFQFDLRMG